MMNIPLPMIVVALAGWVNEQQLAVIEYLKDESIRRLVVRLARCLEGKEQLATSPIRGIMSRKRRERCERLGGLLHSYHRLAA